MKNLILVLTALAGLCFNVFAQDAKRGTIEVSNAYARATPPSAQTGAAYMDIANRGKDGDRLVSISADFSPQIEIHEMAMRGDVMQMRKLENGLAIPAGGAASLAPGGMHLMFLGLTAPLKQGGMLRLKLMFEKAGELDLSVPVKAMGAAGHSHGHD